MEILEQKYIYFNNEEDIHKYVREIYIAFKEHKKYLAEITITPKYNRVYLKITKEPAFINGFFSQN